MESVKIFPKPFPVIATFAAWMRLREIIFFEDRVEAGGKTIFYRDVITLTCIRERAPIPFISNNNYIFQIAAETEIIAFSSGSIPLLSLWGMGENPCDKAFLRLVELSHRYVVPELAQKFHEMIEGTDDWINICGVLFSKKGICVWHRTRRFEFVPWSAVYAASSEPFRASSLMWPCLHIYKQTDVGPVDVFGHRMEYLNFRFIKSNMLVMPELIALCKRTFGAEMVMSAESLSEIKPNDLKIKHIPFLPEGIYKKTRKSIIKVFLIIMTLFLLEILILNLLD